MMNHLKPLLISIITIATMLAYQNCQKMGFNGAETESSQGTLSVDPSTVSFQLNYHMGYGHCMGRCLTGTQISADLVTGELNINNSVMDNSPMETMVAELPPVVPIGTKFTIQLSAQQLEKLKSVVSAIKFENRYVPDCVEDEPCAIMMDNAYFTHFFKDNLGDTHKVFTNSGIDPNLRGESFWVMDDASALACNLKSVIDSATTMKAQEKAESIEGLKTALNFYDGYNPLSCDP